MMILVRKIQIHDSKQTFTLKKSDRQVEANPHPSQGIQFKVS